MRTLLNWLHAPPSTMPLSNQKLYMSLGRWLVALFVGPYLVGISTKLGWPFLLVGAAIWAATWWAFYVRTLRHWTPLKRWRERGNSTGD
jgi:hypothetical protein